MHLSSEIAVDLIEGRLAKAEETFWRGHLGVCRGCAQDIARWEQLKADMKRSHMKSASGEILSTVMEFFPYQRIENEPRCPSVVATLVFDTFRDRSEEHTSELQSHSDLVCRL